MLRGAATEETVTTTMATPEPYGTEPSSHGTVLQGPFWTRHQTADYLSMPPERLPGLDLLVIGGPHSAEEVYPSFQFADRRVDPAVHEVARSLRQKMGDLEACDWLVHPHPGLGRRSPLLWLRRHLPPRDVARLL